MVQKTYRCLIAKEPMYRVCYAYSQDTMIYFREKACGTGDPKLNTQALGSALNIVKGLISISISVKISAESKR